MQKRTQSLGLYLGMYIRWRQACDCTQPVVKGEIKESKAARKRPTAKVSLPLQTVRRKQCTLYFYVDRLLCTRAVRVGVGVNDSRAWFGVTFPTQTVCVCVCVCVCISEAFVPRLPSFHACNWGCQRCARDHRALLDEAGEDPGVGALGVICMHTSQWRTNALRLSLVLDFECKGVAYTPTDPSCPF